ncbi:MAG TPA: serine/threonine-protein kinase, partial [Cellvibrionaceae bacterium]|nr:serine/threonine-protein kinase [Cellvibrionaceae bacterium]
MEYIEGQDLKQARKQLNLQQKIQAVQDIARALDFAASKGYVHRDIKPENIMIAKADHRAVLMDFGIARAAETDLSVTQTGLAIGTPHYMSPEQAKGKAVDARSDLYSLGVVFYLLLTGKVPFDGDSAVAIGIKHITEPPPVLPESLAVAAPILNRLLAKLPGDRYQQAEDLVAALEELKPLLLDAKPLPEEDSPPPAWASAATLVEVSPGIAPQSMDSLAALEATGVLASQPTGILSSQAAGQHKAAEVASGGLTWFGVGLILSLAAAAAALGIWYVNKPEPAASFAALAAGNNKDVKQLKENIALVTKAYQKSESQLPVLVKLYRDLKKLQPDDPSVEQELTFLAQQQLKRLTWALNLADYEQAVLLNKNLKLLFPEFVTEELNRQEMRLSLRAQIQALLLNGEDYVKRGALAQPPGANAREAYEAVLALDPDIAPAREALANIRQAPKDSSRITTAQIAAAPLNTADKLALAKRLAEKGQLFAPAGQNAYELYAQILLKDPGNPAVREASQSLWQSLPGWANRWVKEGAYNTVNEQLTAAGEIKPNDKALQQLHQSIDEKIVERNRNILPQVTGLRVAGFPQDSFDEPQASSLSVSKHLHVRLALAQSSPQILQVNLYEGARTPHRSCGIALA